MELREELGLPTETVHVATASLATATRLLSIVSAEIALYAPAAAVDVQNEAAIRMSGWLNATDGATAIFSELKVGDGLDMTFRSTAVSGVSEGVRGDGVVVAVEETQSGNLWQGGVGMISLGISRTSVVAAEPSIEKRASNYTDTLVSALHPGTCRRLPGGDDCSRCCRGRCGALGEMFCGCDCYARIGAHVAAGGVLARWGGS